MQWGVRRCGGYLVGIGREQKEQWARTLREAGTTVPEIIRRTGLSKASVYRALAASAR
ncbi:MAG TPA: hypothetical protein DCL72_11970 [Rhizobiales bacterium]|nr:hypothetical protein [Hyphomicrobiales bacterium]